MHNPCVAHRGASGEAPENTLAAIRKALGYSSVRWLELDLQLSKDGVPVVMHDDSVSRTTSGRGKVKDLTLLELKRLDAGSWFNRAFIGESIPTLAEVLELVGDRCHLNLEIKPYTRNYTTISQKVLELLRQYGVMSSVVITSFDAAALSTVKQLDADVRTGLIIDAAPPNLVYRLEQLQSDFLSIGYKHLNPIRTDVYMAAGLTVMAWTINDTATMRRIGSLDERILLCTNYPSRCY